MQTMIAEKHVFDRTVHYETPPVVIMHTYKLRLTPSQNMQLVKDLNLTEAAVLSDNTCNISYIILPASNAEMLLSRASAFSASPERTGIAELRLKYRNNRNYTVSGNTELVNVLMTEI